MRTTQMPVAVIALLLYPSLIFGGTVSGNATYAGTPAKPKAIDMSQEPVCAKEHATPVTAETVVTGPNNALANVVVYISAGAPDEGQVPTQAVTLEQKGCQYIPHVLVVHTGQQLDVVNNDQTSHNVHPQAKANREWNKSQPPGARPITEKYDKEEFIPVKCNVHPWMRAYLVVLKTNHYSVSKSDGSFTLPNLPPGRYTLTAWHEDYGTQTAEVTITGNETKKVNFTFKVKSY
ncbi:MAG TPA: carboxypeptidase regulatory-like domain-containing protein [Terriglobales bacterium]|nr:carboxypeptidase regulatory-like domain-containing protein [Terriglobales bacterium]